jgi:hypothetical protein
MTILSTRSTVNPPTDSRVPFAVLIAVLVAFGLYGVFVTGPEMRAVAQANLERTLADENRAFCEKFGMRDGTNEFAACSQELAFIRKAQSERDSQAGAL